MVKKHVGGSPRGSSSHEDERRRSGFRAAARIPDASPRRELEDLADSELDEDTQTSVDAIPVSMVSSSEAATDRHVQLPEREGDLDDDDLEDEADDAIPTVETRVDSAQMLALLAQAGLPSPLEPSEHLRDADTVTYPGTDDPYDDTSPTLPAPPKRPRSK